MSAKKNILICPLEWGLGHAGRMIPLARILQQENNTVFIGTGKTHQQFLQCELEGVQFIDFGGFKPCYSAVLPQYIALLFQIPVLLYHIFSEHIRLGRIIKKYNIDVVISDNRFGLWNKNVISVYITHQIRIPFPEQFRFLEWAGICFHRFFIKKYDLCFIPDLPGEINISGRLSHSVKLPGNARFIGILSRFTGMAKVPVKTYNSAYNTLILSGPEPQRSKLKKIIADLHRTDDLPLVILEGRPGMPDESRGSVNTTAYNHLPSGKMLSIIRESEGIIARAGYTSIMELVSLNCSALLVPTPGQTEQEYLAAHLSEKGWFTMIRQNDLKEGFSLPQKIASWPAGLTEKSRALLASALKELSDK